MSGSGWRGISEVNLEMGVGSMGSLAARVHLRTLFLEMPTISFLDERERGLFAEYIFFTAV